MSINLADITSTSVRLDCSFRMYWFMYKNRIPAHPRKRTPIFKPWYFSQTRNQFFPVLQCRLFNVWAVKDVNISICDSMTVNLFNQQLYLIWIDVILLCSSCKYPDTKSAWHSLTNQKYSSFTPLSSPN